MATKGKRGKAAAYPPIILEYIANQASHAFHETKFSRKNGDDITRDDFKTAAEFGKLAYYLLTNPIDVKSLKLVDLYSDEILPELSQIGCNPQMLQLVGWVCCIFVTHSLASEHKNIHVISSKGFTAIVATLAMVNQIYVNLFDLILRKGSQVPFLPQPFDAAAASLLPSTKAPPESFSGSSSSSSSSNAHESPKKPIAPPKPAKLRATKTDSAAVDSGLGHDFLSQPSPFGGSAGPFGGTSKFGAGGVNPFEVKEQESSSDDDSEKEDTTPPTFSEKPRAKASGRTDRRFGRTAK